MSAVQVVDLVVDYGGDPVVRQASCVASSGHLLAVVGASGSGKTTLLRAIAGFIPVQGGTIEIGDTVVTGPGVSVPPERRGVGIVTQDGSLFPHLTVARNVGFGLPRRAMADGTPVADRVAELLELVGLPGLEGRFPHELSGGQQQRVALARALAPRPAAVLLDEPFSALDAGLRTELGQEVRDLLARSRTTAILVTHDQDEALSLADSVALIIDGRIVQQGTPKELYGRPETLAVATFLGEVNVLPVLGVQPDGRVSTAVGPVAVEGDPSPVGQIALRPEQVRVERAQGAGDGTVGAFGVVGHVAYFGHDSMIEVQLPGGDVVRARMLGDAGVTDGDEVRLQVTGTAQPF